MTTDFLLRTETLPIPDNFPISWNEPDDAKLTWGLDRMHWATPVTPLTGEYIEIFLLSADPVLLKFGYPARMRFRRINTYVYYTQAPLPMNETEIAVLKHQGESYTAETLQGLDRLWEDRYLPEIEASLAFWQGFDLSAASLPELMAHLDESIGRVRSLSEIHHEITILAVLAPSLFYDLYQDLFGEGSAAGTEDPFLAYRMLQAFDNKTLQMSRILWELSRQALALPPIRQVFQDHTPAEVIPALERLPQGRQFLIELQAFLDAHGQRNTTQILELDAPVWLEDPTPVIRNLQEYLTQPDRDLEGELAAQASEREQMVAETLQHLQGYPQPVIDQFHLLLKAAQAGVFLSEEHNYWIDYCMTYQLRRVILEFGRRFSAEGALAAVEDVFYLAFEEIRATASESQRFDWGSTVAGRRAEMAYFRTIQPPPVVGVPPLEPPADDPMVRADLRFWGASLTPSNNSHVLHGNPGSPGRARGPARVVRSLAETGKLQKGDVLVAETTLPPWTPLFATAAAVVTDTGGVLSHCAVVAREYGIPAVVGVGVATSVIQDGQMLDVNGSEGVIRILSVEG